MAPAAILCWCLFLLTGCKDPVIENGDLLTNDDELNLAKDTLHVKVFSEFVMPLQSNGVTTGVVANLTDPNFGKTTAGLYAQCLLTSNNINFGTTAVLDSAVLMLGYSDRYGKFDNPVTLSAYELSDNMIDSVSYYTNTSFGVTVPAIGQLNNFVPNLTDSIHVYGLTYPPHLRIPLTTAFGNKLLLADTAYFVDNTSFKNLFKGFYLSTSSASNGNGLLYFNLLSSLSGVTLYYHTSTDDSLTYYIPVSGVKVNHFDNNYASAPVNTSVTNPNPAGENKIYLQGGAGVRGKIFITDLDSLPKNIAVNKAELVLTQANGDTAYPAPLLLDLYRIDDVGQPAKLDDDGLSSFGGVRVTETVNGENVVRYRFNIKKYFQKLITGAYSNNGFYLQVLAGNSNSERLVIANSSTDEKYKVSLVVTYTKL